MNVLFICSGNVFRSMSGEYCFKKFIKKHKIQGINISSAGTIAKGGDVANNTQKRLKKLGLDASKHIPRRLTKEMVDNNDLIIAMAENHLFRIRELGGDPILFNDLAFERKESIEDNFEAVPEDDVPKRHAYEDKTISYIKDSMPDFYKGLLKYKRNDFIFEHFVNRRMNVHGRNEFPLDILYETDHSVVFLSQAIPEKQDGHLLIVPKKRYVQLHDIPSIIQNDLIQTLAFMGKVLMKTHGGYNILLNNGAPAGQFIFHTHFHMVPRNENDDIEIEVWKERKLTKAEFLKLNNKIKKQIRNETRSN